MVSSVSVCVSATQLACCLEKLIASQLLILGQAIVRTGYFASYLQARVYKVPVLQIAMVLGQAIVRTGYFASYLQAGAFKVPVLQIGVGTNAGMDWTTGTDYWNDLCKHFNHKH